MRVLQICIFSGAPYGACTVCRVSWHESVKLLQLSGFSHMPEKKSLYSLLAKNKNTVLIQRAEGTCGTVGIIVK